MLALRATLRVCSYRALRTPMTHLRHYHPTYPRFHQPIGLSERKDNFLRWARYRDDGKSRSVMTGLLNLTVVTMVGLATVLTIRDANQVRSETPILKMMIQLQRLDAEYGTMDLSDASEAALYVKRLMGDFLYSGMHADSNPWVLQVVGDEESRRVLQQFATELHTTLIQNKHKPTHEYMRIVFGEFLTFVILWAKLQRKFLERLQEGLELEWGTSFETIG